jgi:hypothetical protein
VFQTPEVNDAEALAERLALGLIQHGFPSPTRTKRWGHYRSGLVALSLLCGPVLIAFTIWQHSNPAVPAAPPTEAPTAYRTSMPTDESAEITLEEVGDRPSWLQFDGSNVHISGVAPLTAGDELYHVMLRAMRGDGRDGHLHVYVTRTELAEPKLSCPSTEPGPSSAGRTLDNRQFPRVVKFGW